MSAANLRNDLGPYKATKLWNDIVRVFRTGMPIGRHWRQFRSYDDCFVSSDAVDWLLEYLQQHHTSGPEITRAQVVKLLQKFHRTHYIEDARGPKYDSDIFEEGNRLFRFVALSPIKTPQWPKHQLTAANKMVEQRLAAMADVRTDNLFGDEERPQPHKPVYSKMAPACNTSTAQLKPAINVIKNPNTLWKTVVLDRLRSFLGLDDLTEIVEEAILDYRHVRHNVKVVHRNGYVTGVSKNDLPPTWVVTAMRFLARWPEKGGEAFPEYPGFEKDVYVMIREYFENCKHPILTHQLYTPIINFWKLIEDEQPSPIARSTTRVLHVSETTPNRRYPVHRNRRSNSFNARSLSSGSRSQSSASSPPSSAGAYAESPDYSDAPPIYDVPRLLPGRLYDNRPTANCNDHLMVVYDSPLKRQQPPQYYMYEQPPPYGSYRHAIENNHQRNTNYNNNNNDNMDNHPSGPRRLRGRGNLQKAASLSHLLAGPRVETAFVGDDAYTVYYGEKRVEKRVPAHSSCINLTKAYSSANIAREMEPQNDIHRHKSNQHLRTVGISREDLTQYKRQQSPDEQYTQSATYYSCQSEQLSNHTRQSIEYHRRAQLSMRPQSYHHPDAQWVGREPDQEAWSGRNAQTYHQRQMWPSVATAPSQHNRQKSWQSYQDAGSIHLKLHSTPSVYGGTMPRDEFFYLQSLDLGLFTEQRDSKLIQTLQYLLLFLPPANRRVLHMLLRLMNRVTYNRQLILDQFSSNKRTEPEDDIWLEIWSEYRFHSVGMGWFSRMVERLFQSVPARVGQSLPLTALSASCLQVLCALWRCVLRSDRESQTDEFAAMQIVEFLVDHYEQILAVPTGLQQEVEAKIHQQHKHRSDANTALSSRTNLKGNPPTVPPKALKQLGIPSEKPVFCERITSEQYENQAQAASRIAMAELLNNIIDDKRMSGKEKAKKLKQFEKAYPEVYRARIPNQETLKAIIPSVYDKDHKKKTFPTMNLLRKLR